MEPIGKTPFPLDEHGSYYPGEDMNYLGVTVSLQEWLDFDKAIKSDEHGPCKLKIVRYNGY